MVNKECTAECAAARAVGLGGLAGRAPHPTIGPGAKGESTPGRDAKELDSAPTTLASPCDANVARASEVYEPGLTRVSGPLPTRRISWTSAPAAPSAPAH